VLLIIKLIRASQNDFFVAILLPWETSFTFAVVCVLMQVLDLEKKEISNFSYYIYASSFVLIFFPAVFLIIFACLWHKIIAFVMNLMGFMCTFHLKSLHLSVLFNQICLYQIIHWISHLLIEQVQYLLFVWLSHPGVNSLGAQPYIC